MREKMQRFMYGRCGVDELSGCLLYGAIALLVLNLFLPGNLLFLIAIVMTIYGYYRAFSKNFTKRDKENYWYLQKTKPVRDFVTKKVNRLKMRENYHLYTCKQCKQVIRIPKGKGKIEITCPKCGNRFIKKS